MEIEIVAKKAFSNGMDINTPVHKYRATLKDGTIDEYYCVKRDDKAVLDAACHEHGKKEVVGCLYIGYGYIN